MRAFCGDLPAVDLEGLFRGARPTILVVTDLPGGFADHTDLSLCELVGALRRGRPGCLAPVVVTAHVGDHRSAELRRFDFADPVRGLSRVRYDVLIVVGAVADGELPVEQRDAVARFMNDGGGVFATGDVGGAGARLCGDLPRVRALRAWRGRGRCGAVPPSFRPHPQRLYPSWSTVAGGRGQVHPILQCRSGAPVEHLPTPPWDAGCVVPEWLEGRWRFADGVEVAEWPHADRVRPEVVALTVAHGAWHEGVHPPVPPRPRPALVAWDGQRAGVGRVVVGATWHHLVDLHIDGGADPDRGGLRVHGVDTTELVRLREHWHSLVAWLLPADRRRALHWVPLYRALVRYPLAEELVLPLPPYTALEARLLVGAGAEIEAALRRR